MRFASTYVIVLPTVLVIAPLDSRFAASVARALDGVKENPKTIALEAWRRNGHGHGGGSLEPWFEMLTEDVVITMPLGTSRGENRGIASARRIYGAIASATPRLVYQEPTRVSVAETTVVIEFHDHGTIAKYAYRNLIAASFDIRDGTVAAYRSTSATSTLRSRI